MSRPVPPSDDQAFDEDDSLSVEFRLQVFARNPRELALLRRLATLMERPFAVVLRETSAASGSAPPEEPEEHVAGWKVTAASAGVADSSPARSASRLAGREGTPPRPFVFFDDLSPAPGAVDWPLQPVLQKDPGDAPADEPVLLRRRLRRGPLRVRTLVHLTALSGLLTAAWQRGHHASRLIGQGLDRGSRWAAGNVRDRSAALRTLARSARPGFVRAVWLPVAALLLLALGAAAISDRHSRTPPSPLPEGARITEVRLDPVTTLAGREPAEGVLDAPVGAREPEGSRREDLREPVRPTPSRLGTMGTHSASAAEPSVTARTSRPRPPATAATVSDSRPVASRTTPAAAPVKPPFLGALLVQSEPAGARVAINGRPVGTTPLRLPDVRAGSHAVRVQLDGYRRWSTAARVVAGQETQLSVLLQSSETQ